MNYKKIFKRETKVIAYVVICMTILVIGTSYALFLQVDNNTNNQVVEAGTLTVTYSGGNTITVDDTDESNCLIPQSDADGSGSGGCSFNLSITNTGTLPMEYNLLIYDNKSAAPSGATLVDHSLIRHSLKKQYTKAGTNETLTSSASLSELEIYESTNKKTLENAIIDAGETITFALNIWIDEDASTDIIGQYVYLKLDVAGAVSEPICKRATTLHTETCKNTDNTLHCQADGYTNGQTITYGSLGKKGVLTVGDAFDCDVNGDGEYNANTERFYYVSDVNNTTAALIFYSGVSGGDANNTAAYPYNSNTTSYLGPQSSTLQQLPTTEKWSNVSLKNTTRNIYDENGTKKVSNYSYKGYAARFLTYQELNRACYDKTTLITKAGGLSTNCKFLLENTIYSTPSYSTGYWLESVSAISTVLQWDIYGISRSSANDDGYYAMRGVRPAIDVAKSRIDY